MAVIINELEMVVEPAAPEAPAAMAAATAPPLAPLDLGDYLEHAAARAERLRAT